MLLVSWIVNGYVCFNTTDRAMYQRNNQNIAAPSYLVIKYEAKAGDVELSLEKKKKKGPQTMINCLPCLKGNGMCSLRRMLRN